MAPVAKQIDVQGQPDRRSKASHVIGLFSHVFKLINPYEVLLRRKRANESWNAFFRTATPQPHKQTLIPDSMWAAAAAVRVRL